MPPRRLEHDQRRCRRVRAERGLPEGVAERRGRDRRGAGGAPCRRRKRRRDSPARLLELVAARRRGRVGLGSSVSSSRHVVGGVEQDAHQRAANIQPHDLRGSR